MPRGIRFWKHHWIFQLSRKMWWLMMIATFQSILFTAQSPFWLLFKYTFVQHLESLKVASDSFGDSFLLLDFCENWKLEHPVSKIGREHDGESSKNPYRSGHGIRYDLYNTIYIYSLAFENSFENISPSESCQKVLDHPVRKIMSLHSSLVVFLVCVKTKKIHNFFVCEGFLWLL